MAVAADLCRVSSDVFRRREIHVMVSGGRKTFRVVLGEPVDSVVRQLAAQVCYPR